MPLPIKNLHTVDSSGPYIVEINADIPLRTATKSTPDDPLLVRANIYRPKSEGQFPVLVTYGPCKFNYDPHLKCKLNKQYRWKRCPILQVSAPMWINIDDGSLTSSSFHPKSFSELNAAQKSAHSAWETPDPAFWTGNGYAVVRADERGCGQSPGRLDSMSRATSDGFYDVVEWAAEQPWSSGKVGLLGISYYAGSQWRVAARKPKGLAAMIPWEGERHTSNVFYERNNK